LFLKVFLPNPLGLLKNGNIQPEIVNILQGRVNQSILTRHYLVPDANLRDNILAGLTELSKPLGGLPGQRAAEEREKKNGI
jgi:hypothetical protein